MAVTGVQQVTGPLGACKLRRGLQVDGAKLFGKNVAVAGVVPEGVLVQHRVEGVERVAVDEVPVLHLTRAHDDGGLVRAIEQEGRGLGHHGVVERVGAVLRVQVVLVYEDDALADVARAGEAVVGVVDDDGTEHAVVHLDVGRAMQVGVVPVNAVGVVGRDGDFVLAAAAGTHACIGGVHHIVAKDARADFLGVHMQAVKVQVGTVLVVQIAQ